jgi:tRNA-dihydrouridine synthase A
MDALNPQDWRFCVAPMLDLTDRHCRYFHRVLSKKARLYTEMVTCGALIYGDKNVHLDFSEAEHPVALQLGGSDPADLAACAKLAKDWGYDEVNLNCGCPSERVQKGSFGACLMESPKLVADCVKAMQDACDLPVTVKHRIGIDKIESFEFVRDFVATLYDVGVRVFIVHTRNAWLKGLSPKENREIPPLRREVAVQLKRDFPDAVIVSNGAIKDLQEGETVLKEGVDGIMVGRAAYYTPWLLTDVDSRLYNVNDTPVTREKVVDVMSEYLRSRRGDTRALRATCRHMHGLLTGLAGAKVWRRTLSDSALIDEHQDEILRFAYALAGWRDLDEDSLEFLDD